MKDGERPFSDFTEEELNHLKWIREVGGKGYIRGYRVKMVHVCPNCRLARGLYGSTFLPSTYLACRNCDYRFSSLDEWFDLDTVERWTKI